MKPFWTSAAVLLLVLVAPAGAQPGQEPEADSYFPLREGATWTYEAGGTLITIKLTKQGEKKVGTAMVSYSRLETTINNMPASSEEVAKLPQGFCRIAIDDKPVDPPLCFLALPPEKGKEWKKWPANAKVGSETITGEYAGSREEVDAKATKVPYYAAKEEKLKLLVVKGSNLKVNDQVLDLTCYFAPDVGLIKQEGTFAGVKVDLRLKSFEVNK